ncbi:chromogranin A, isoform CRA_d [Rattus norvegicus]|uniref:Chromogranin-A n=1 Tax=Rattus norvegicus TaxID=10116 RepID=A6JEK6_RAT|nr:chromogranin A, isoform CRA_d [Rattus norvegicus]
MRSSAALALLLCAGQVFALPVNSPMTKGDTKVMKCVLEVISDSLSKPSPMPVSPECLETLQGDERVLSILRHQNLLKELQDLALQDAASEAPSKDTVEKREDSDKGQQDAFEGTTEGPRPQAFPEPKQESSMMGNSQSPGEDTANNTQSPTSLPSQEHGIPQTTEGSERGPSAQQQARKAKQEEKEEEEEEKEEEEEEKEEKAIAREKAGPKEVPTAASSSHFYSGYKKIQKDDDGQSESQAVNGKTGASEAVPSEGKGELEHSQQEEDGEEAMAGPPQGLFPGGKGQELERKQQEEEEEEERLSREWEDKRWSRMDQLAKELTAEKRLEGEDDPDRSMKLSFRARAYGFRDPGPQLRRGWRPSSREDSVEARGDFEEKKEEEGSANRRAEDQELESLSAIEAELEKVAHQLQALRRG